MNFKRVISTVTAMAAALSVSSFAASAQITDKGDTYKTEADVSTAKSKPVLTVTKKVFDTAADAKGKTVTVEFKLGGENVDKKYCSTGFKVQWDDRLLPVATSRGKYAKEDSAIDDLLNDQEKDGTNGVFLCTAGKEDLGHTGTMWTIDLKVPDDVKEGDVFPIDVYYFEIPDLAVGLFTNFDNDKNGKLMESYFFTKGINSKENPSTDPYLEEAKYADGYIAVKEAVPATQPSDALQGDANCDGKVDEADISAIMDYYADILSGNNGKLTEQGKKNADVDGDGQIDAADASKVSYFIKNGTFDIPTTGDLNDDGEINLKDVVLLRRYIAGGWGVKLDEKKADVNGDNELNLKDVVILRRYIAGGWGVKLK